MPYLKDPPKPKPLILIREDDIEAGAKALYEKANHAAGSTLAWEKAHSWVRDHHRDVARAVLDAVARDRAAT